jgi:hypothetical protein
MDVVDTYIQCCLPRRLRILIDRSQSFHCAQCEAQKRPSRALSLAYRCTNHVKTERIHLFGAAFCDLVCLEAFGASITQDGYVNVLAVVPYPVGDVKTDPVLKAAVVKSLHPLLRAVTSGRVCDNCTARHLEGTTSFKVCSACGLARYCSPECQLEHWRSTHKKSCGKPQPVLPIKLHPEKEEDKAALFAQQNAEEDAHIDCFNEKQLYHRKALREGRCSYVGCNRKPPGLVALELNLHVCWRGTMKHHTTPLFYCNRRCRERDCRGETVVAAKPAC